MIDPNKDLLTDADFRQQMLFEMKLAAALAKLKQEHYNFLLKNLVN